MISVFPLRMQQVEHTQLQSGLELHYHLVKLNVIKCYFMHSSFNSSDVFSVSFGPVVH